MRWQWPWKSKKSAKAQEHREELAEVTNRLDVVADRFDRTADRFDDHIAVLRQNGDDE